MINKGGWLSTWVFKKTKQFLLEWLKESQGHTMVPCMRLILKCGLTFSDIKKRNKEKKNLALT